MNRAQHVDPWIMGTLKRIQPVTITCRSDGQLRLQAVQMTERIRVQPASQREQSESNVSSGVKRDARAAEHLDEDDQGGKFQLVEGLTMVDAEEIPCEFSVEDDFEVDESAEGVEEETVEAILAGKKRESLTRWKRSESSMCAKNCRKTRRSSQRDGKAFQKVRNGVAGS